jgi:primosomal protein N'
MELVGGIPKSLGSSEVAAWPPVTSLYALNGVATGNRGQDWSDLSPYLADRVRDTLSRGGQVIVLRRRVRTAGSCKGCGGAARQPSTFGPIPTSCGSSRDRHCRHRRCKHERTAA